jgi:hypothetical protein
MNNLLKLLDNPEMKSLKNRPGPGKIKDFSIHYSPNGT